MRAEPNCTERAWTGQASARHATETDGPDENDNVSTSWEIKVNSFAAIDWTGEELRLASRRRLTTVCADTNRDGEEAYRKERDNDHVL